MHHKGATSKVPYINRSYGHLKDDLPSSSGLGDLHVEFPEAILKLEKHLDIEMGKL